MRDMMKKMRGGGLMKMMKKMGGMGGPKLPGMR
jgi:signal recognition particle subunit SRP54